MDWSDSTTELVAKGLHQKPGLVTIERRTVHEQAGWLRYDDDVIVDMQDRDHGVVDEIDAAADQAAGDCGTPGSRATTGPPKEKRPTNGAFLMLLTARNCAY